MLAVRQLSISIARSCAEVYDFLAVPENFAQWASGLGQGLQKAGEVWRVQSPEGPVTVRFTPRNTFGVLDHTVTPPGGGDIYIPMRVIANGAGSEVLFTLFRQPGMTDAKFAADAEWVLRDLYGLKQLLEA